jgi:predicted cupin superfamily sugar epimerase
MIDFHDSSLPASALREKLGLSPHPEGGHYREIWRDLPAGGGRGAATTILFLLAEGELSRWHRVDAAEIWLWHAGAPLHLGLRAKGDGGKMFRLGPHPDAGEVLQAVVPAGVWQEARSLGAWSLVGCVVAPAFEFSGFDLAPPGWEPPV